MNSGLSGATCVSINEVRLALELGFAPKRIILNGNGKTPAELREAIAAQVIINVDSNFDFENIQRAAKEVDKKADVLIRVNPDIDPVVHPYISTGLKTSKFGVVEEEVFALAERISKSDFFTLAGIHCHLGSTIKQLEPIKDCAERLGSIVEQISSFIEHENPIINVGGGLGIRYNPADEAYPSVQESCIHKFIQYL